jgi:hypothetical protein
MIWLCHLFSLVLEHVLNKNQVIKSSCFDDLYLPKMLIMPSMIHIYNSYREHLGMDSGAGLIQRMCQKKDIIKQDFLHVPLTSPEVTSPGVNVSESECTRG